MAPASRALFRSINCWPVVGFMVAFLGPPPTSQAHPASKATAETTINTRTSSLFMGVCCVSLMGGKVRCGSAPYQRPRANHYQQGTETRSRASVQPLHQPSTCPSFKNLRPTLSPERAATAGPATALQPQSLSALASLCLCVLALNPCPMKTQRRKDAKTQSTAPTTHADRPGSPDPAPGTPDLKPRRSRGVRCIRWIGHQTVHIPKTSGHLSRQFAATAGLATVPEIEPQMNADEHR